MTCSIISPKFLGLLVGDFGTTRMILSIWLLDGVLCIGRGRGVLASSNFIFDNFGSAILFRVRSSSPPPAEGATGAGPWDKEAADSGLNMPWTLNSAFDICGDGINKSLLLSGLDVSLLPGRSPGVRIARKILLDWKSLTEGIRRLLPPLLPPPLTTEAWLVKLRELGSCSTCCSGSWTSVSASPKIKELIFNLILGPLQGVKLVWILIADAF